MTKSASEPSLRLGACLCCPGTRCCSSSTYTLKSGVWFPVRLNVVHTDDTFCRLGSQGGGRYQWREPGTRHGTLPCGARTGAAYPRRHQHRHACSRCLPLRPLDCPRAGHGARDTESAATGRPGGFGQSPGGHNDLMFLCCYTLVVLGATSVKPRHHVQYPDVPTLSVPTQTLVRLSKIRNMS